MLFMYAFTGHSYVLCIVLGRPHGHPLGLLVAFTIIFSSLLAHVGVSYLFLVGVCNASWGSAPGLKACLSTSHSF